MQIQHPSKQLDHLLAKIDEPYEWLCGNRSTAITGITWDYKKVAPGNAYCGLQHEEFSEEHIREDSTQYYQEALDNGAICLITQDAELTLAKLNTAEGDSGNDAIVVLRVQNVNAFMGALSREFYDSPFDQMYVVGITGTNGKTTTSQFLDAIFRQHDMLAGVIGTIGVFCGDYYDLSPTLSNPLANDLFRYGSIMRKMEADALTLEVTSHGMAFGRNDHIDFDVAVFTNLTQDHLDFHETFEAYKAEKLKHFQRLGGGEKKAFAVVNADDANSNDCIEAIPAERRRSEKVTVLTYGIKNKDAHLICYPKNMNYAGSVFHLFHKKIFLSEVRLSTPGLFNIYNALAAFTAAYALQIPISSIVAGLESVSCVPGRFELVPDCKGRDVIIDYAHTPDALANILKTLGTTCRRRLICVFGCGGDRDQSKRAEMGSIAEQRSDLCYITSDNPRTEDPQHIIADILSGIPEDKQKTAVVIQSDRRQAIIQALTASKPGDTVLIAGKGHEQFQVIGTEKVHFSDREEVIKYFQSLRLSKTTGARITQETSLAALRHNFSLFVADKPPKLRFLSVVKDNALGVGAELMAREALAAGAAGLCVSCVREARHMRRAFPSATILVLGERSPTEYQECLDLSLRLQVQSKDMLSELNQIAAECGKEAQIDIKVDSGMGRYGARWGQEAAELYRHAQSLPQIRVAGVMTHFAQSDETDKTHARLQWRRFEETLEFMRAIAPLPADIHACNSGGYLDLPECHATMVRVGILPTGVYPSLVCRRIKQGGVMHEGAQSLEPVMRITTQISFLKSLSAGDRVGYGMSYRATADMQIAVLPVGYGDGYPRMKNTGGVLIQGQFCKLIGGVSLNAMIVALPDNLDPVVGEEVVLVGQQQEAEISFRDLADWAQTVVYDVMTRFKREAMYIAEI